MFLSEILILTSFLTFSFSGDAVSDKVGPEAASGGSEAVVHSLMGDSPSEDVAPEAAIGGAKPVVHSRTIWAKRKSKGQQRARVSWRTKVRLKYGNKYTDWSKATDKGYRISYNPGRRPWRITAYGRPRR